MDVLGYVGLGFSVALEPLNLLFCFVGVLIGTLVGVLPGLGPVAALSARCAVKNYNYSQKRGIGAGDGCWHNESPTGVEAPPRPEQPAV